MKNESYEHIQSDSTDEVQSEATPEKKRSLYDISADYADFDSLIESIDPDEITPEQQEALDAYYKTLSEERDAKLDNYGGLIKDIEARGNARKEEAARIEALADADLAKVKLLKGRLLGFFQVNKITSAIQTLRFKFARQNNGGVAPLIIEKEYEDNPVTLPEQFVKMVPEIDREALRKALDGEDEELKALAATVASIGKRGEHLRIR